MGAPDPHLIEALRRTADRLEDGARYSWTHQGHCNCGHLVQTITRLSPEEIHAQAVRSLGEWADHAVDYCEGSGVAVDHILDQMFELGLGRDDVRHLEGLSDPRVLRRVDLEQRPLDKRRRSDVVLYMRTWAELLDEQRQAFLSRHRLAAK